MDNVKDKLLGVMEDIFQIDKSLISTETSSETLKEWDSLKHMILLMAIEEEFEFRFTDDEMVKCVSVASILELLESKE